MVRRIFGKLIEWALGYERRVFYTGFRRISTSPTNTNIPWSGHHDDAGFDLYVNKEIIIQPNSTAQIPTGICLSARAKIWFEIKGRSSTFSKLGLEVIDAVIDHGFRGEMYSVVYNPTDKAVNVALNSRICQIVPHLLLPCVFIPADRLKSSSRGKKGFGSTGW